MCTSSKEGLECTQGRTSAGPRACVVRQHVSERGERAIGGGHPHHEREEQEETWPLDPSTLFLERRIKARSEKWVRPKLPVDVHRNQVKIPQAALDSE